MKLSEALRIGIQKKPKQGFGMLFPEIDSSCAIGAIIDGFGLAVLDENNFYHSAPCIDQKIPALFKNYGADQITLFSMIIVMNDKENKAREEIATWLESINE